MKFKNDKLEMTVSGEKSQTARVYTYEKKIDPIYIFH